ncbi:TMV resistance protein N [Cajanus cajan]|uniref:TMV resistance protein N n=1 Tax=Cajanus cajan TaxID=3821 RepID=A0A151RE93_CAJCA|nr:TMV resistance protein N [Cajanus cajan]KYP40912.1 TMV resistance protein N [Cajanus cajan]
MANGYATKLSDFSYDVFLSFSGGASNAFVDPLCRALHHRGINIFRSEDGKTRPAIEEIEKSKMAMVVLCHNYAFSKESLDELAKISEYVDNKRKQVWAIFYKVEPSDVRKQKNSYKKAMDGHEMRYGKNSEKVKAWGNALTRVCDLSGIHFKDDMFEAELEKIVEAVFSKLAPVPVQMNHVVGLDYHFEQVKSFLDVESSDTVRMLGIYGAGGIGKTTLAVYLYEKIRHYYFEAASFLIKDRENPNKSNNLLEDLQKKLLSLMGVETETMMGSTNKGELEIKRRLGHRRVLLVLDDVDTKEQLESLVGKLNWFGSGSRIIITTRDAAVLDYDNGIKKYKMEELKDCDALELFCWNAFDMPGPAKNFENIAHRAIGYAKGVPLALQVLGSNLKGRIIEEWEIELGKYRKVPNAEIQGVLEISYYSLPEPEMKIFLDIACFFKGEKSNYVKRILMASDLSIQVLTSKCLLIVDENGCLEMHDLIQDMGREVVRKESPYKPGNRSRLWSHEDVLQVLKENSGSSTIEGIMLHPPRLEEVENWTNTAFEKMKNLRILIVRNTKFSTGPSYLPNNLRLLDWIGFPSKSFPPSFYPENIVDFKLSHSPLVLEKSLEKVFQDLTFVNLSHCQFITQIPNMHGAKNLRVLTIDKCLKLEGFHQSIGHMPNLVYLSTSECIMLRSFVPRMYLPSLEMLSFNFCSKLEKLPEVVRKMDKPLKIHMKNTAIKKFPDSICKLTGLEYVDMSACTGLRDISSFVSLPKLVTLKMNGCSQLAESFKMFRKSLSEANSLPNLKELHLSRANLSYEDLSIVLHIFPELEYLNVSHNEIESIPECIKGSLQLKNLDVSFCRNLGEIPELPSSIQRVNARYCQSLTIESSRVLLSKVYKEMERIHVVMPKTGIPKGFQCIDREDIPLFWARRKFPVVALAFVFREVKTKEDILMDTSELLPGVVSAEESYTVGLNLFIGGQEICCKVHNYCSVGDHHMLVCDLQVLFNDEGWKGLDAYVGDDWKAIQVQCESTLSLSHWGVYVYKQKTNTDDILFSFPDSTSLVSKASPQKKTRHIQCYDAIEKFGQNLNSFKIEQTASVANMLLRWWRNAKANIRGDVSASTYDASLLQEHEDVVWDLAHILEMLMETLPKHTNSEVQRTGQLVVELLVAQAQHIKEYYHEKFHYNLTMPIILVECQCHPCTDLERAQSLRYWGTVELEEGDPLVWKIWKRNEAFKERLNYTVLLKCEHHSTKEASSSSHRDSLVEEYNDPTLQALMRRIEEDTARLNKSYAKLKASIVQTNVPVSEKYLLEMTIIRGLESLGRLGSNFFKTTYGKLRMEHDAHSTTHVQHELRMDHGAQSSTLNKEQHKLGVEHDAQNSNQEKNNLVWIRLLFGRFWRQR